MPYSNTTQNMGLPQYSLNDRPDMDDFNDAFSKIDVEVTNHVENSTIHVNKLDKDKWNGGSNAWVATNVTVEDSNTKFNLTIPNFVFTEGCQVSFKTPVANISTLYNRLNINGTTYDKEWWIRLISGMENALPDGTFGAQSIVTVTLSNTFPTNPDFSSRRVAFHSGQQSYELGTWTPTFRGLTSAGSPVYLERNGRYVRTGNRVDVYFYVALTSKGGMTGNIRIGGLPFSASGTGGGGVSGNVQGMNLPSGYVFAPLTAEGNDLVLRKANNTGVAAIADTEISDTFRCYSGHASYSI